MLNAQEGDCRFATFQRRFQKLFFIESSSAESTLFNAVKTFQYITNEEKFLSGIFSESGRLKNDIIKTFYYTTNGEKLLSRIFSKIGIKSGDSSSRKPDPPPFFCCVRHSGRSSPAARQPPSRGNRSYSSSDPAEEAPLSSLNSVNNGRHSCRGRIWPSRALRTQLSQSDFLNSREERL